MAQFHVYVILSARPLTNDSPSPLYNVAVVVVVVVDYYVRMRR